METKEQLRREYVEWTVNLVEAHKRFESLLPSVEQIRDLEEPPSWVFTEELVAECEKAQKDEEKALAKIHEIVDKLSKLGGK